MAASTSGASAAAAAIKLYDKALAAAQKLEEEAASLQSTNTKRRQQLQMVADLLKSPATAQDRVSATTNAHEKERAQADALEQQTTTLRDRLRSDSFRDDVSQDGNNPIASDTAAIAHLHNQAAAIQNIRHLIPIVLDLQSSNYSKWRGYVLLVLSHFTMKDHVLSDASRLHNPVWSHMDCVVVTWIFNTISTDLLDIIHERDGISAQAVWLGLEQQFLNNREYHAMLLDSEFRTLSQGALSIDEFCRKMKGMADALADLGEPV
jgi:hypothetical protein